MKVYFSPTIANYSINKPTTKKNNFSSNPNQIKSTSFRGLPWKVDYHSLGLAGKWNYSHSDALKVYEKLKCGNYLDIGADRTNFYVAKQIRNENLSFLDKVRDTYEKKEFMRHYWNITAFPWLQFVSKKILGEFNKALDAASKEGGPYEVVQAGYDGVCSVARGKAFPGSDLDKAYVIIKGADSDYMDEYYVNEFKGKLWFNTDQRILSYNHDEASFPQVYTERQVLKLAEAAEKEARRIYEDYTCDVGCPTMHAYENYMRYLSRKDFEDIKNTYNKDYLEANRFYNALCSGFPKVYRDKVDFNNPSKNDIINLGFMLEAMREGVILKQGSNSNLLNNLKDKYVYRFTNLSQLKALKSHSDQKNKRIARENLQKEFESWDIDKQFRFVKTLIQSACANNTYFTDEFEMYFSKPGDDLFEPMLKKLRGES